MAAKKRITEEEKKMAFDGIVPPGRTEDWRKYFVRRYKWNAKKKAEKQSGTKEEKQLETEIEENNTSESVVIPAI